MHYISETFKVLLQYIGMPHSRILYAPVTDILQGIGQNGRRLYRKKGMEDCGYMVCGSKIFFVPFVNYEPNIQHTL